MVADHSGLFLFKDHTLAERVFFAFIVSRREFPVVVGEFQNLAMAVECRIILVNLDLGRWQTRE
jgi:hypothetical protein